MAGVAWRKPKENSIAALEYGMEHADGVEMDLRLTSEGEVVIHHDPRTPSGKYPERYGYDDLNTKWPFLMTFSIEAVLWTGGSTRLALCAWS